MKTLTKTFLGLTIEIIQASLESEAKAIIKKEDNCCHTMKNKDPELLCNLAMAWIEHKSITNRLV